MLNRTQQQRQRGFSAVSSANRSNTPTTTTNAAATSRQGAAKRASPRAFHFPERAATPSVLHVFPATARQQVQQQFHQQQQQQRSGSTNNINNPNSRTGSPLVFNNKSRTGSPAAFQPSSRNGSPAQNNIHKTKSAFVSPFRDVHRQPTSQTLDGRLLYLLKDFSTTVMPTQDQKVQNIASRLRRSKILTDKEMNALETCHQRNANFMGTIERLLGEAVEAGIDMRRSVVHQAYEIWRICNDANSYITTLLDTAQSAIGVGKFSRTNINGNGFNQSSASAMQNRSASSAFQSPAIGSTQQQQQRANSPVVIGGGSYPVGRSTSRRAQIPEAFNQIARPDAPPRQHLQHFDQQYTRNGSQMRLVDFSQQPTVLATATSGQNNFLHQHPHHQQYNITSGRGRSASGTNPQNPPVQVEDAREAQAMFEKLFGPEEGRTRFLHWLSELPESTIQQLHRSLSH